MSWTAITFSSGDFPTNPKLTAMVDRDQAVKDAIEAHTHNGTDSSLLLDPSATIPGAVAYVWKEVTVASGSSGSVYLTSDGTSGGDDIFDGSTEPDVIVLRGDPSHATPSSGTWSAESMGHNPSILPAGNGTNREYYTRLTQSSGKWLLTVYNGSTAYAMTWLIIAIGKGV